MGARSIVGLFLTWAVLAAAVRAGVVTTSREYLTELSAPVGLDYDRIVGTLAPLDDAFIANTLGLAAPRTATPRAVGEAPRGPAQGVDPPGANSARPAPTAPDESRLVVSHPPDNDRVVDAHRVPRIPFTATTDSSSASRDANEPTPCGPTARTLWYRYVAQGARTGLIATTAGSGHPTSLGVFQGADANDLQLVGCDTALSGDAHVAFPAVEDATYWFQVGAPTGGGRTVFTLDASGATERVSVTATGGEVVGAYDRTQSAVTPDGRFVAFASSSSGFVDGDDNGVYDVFLKDRATGAVELVSVTPDGRPGNLESGIGLGVAVSADARYVAFGSFASDLVADDTNDERDVFVRDRVTAVTTRVSISSSGRQGTAPPAAAVANGEAQCALYPLPHTASTFDVPCGDILTTLDISADGRVVVFGSWLWGLVDGQPDSFDPFRWLEPTLLTSAVGPTQHVYAHDRGSGATVRLSSAPGGQPGDGSSGYPSISADGRVVAYYSVASNLVAGDTNDESDVLVHDRSTGVTRLVSVASDGRQGDAQAGIPSISANGRHVAFQSTATTLVEDDTNNLTDAFVHDLTTGITERVSVSSTGEQQVAGNDLDDRRYASPLKVRISADGRQVAFESQAVNLSPADEPRVYGDPDCQDDTFVRDRSAGTTLMVSVSSAGEQANVCTHLTGFSADGTHVVFTSLADNLVADDRNSRPGISGFQVLDGEDLFVHTLGGRSW